MVRQSGFTSEAEHDAAHGATPGATEGAGADRSGTISGGHGVWDGAANGWRSGLDLTEQEARRLASDLELQYDMYGQRPSDTLRRVEPARRVDHARWQHAGVLDVWVRDRGQWYGRVWDDAGTPRWYPATELRPSTDPPPGQRPPPPGTPGAN